MKIEEKKIQIQNFTVFYRRAINADKDFYIENGERISVLLLHGPDWQSEIWEWMGTILRILQKTEFPKRAKNLKKILPKK